MENHEAIYRKKIFIFSAMMLVLASISIFMSANINKSNEIFSNYVDVAGQQRMLSQRIALSTSAVANARNADTYKNYIEEAKSAIGRLEDNQIYLNKIVTNDSNLNNQYNDYFHTANENGISKYDQIDTYIGLANKYIRLAGELPYESATLRQLQKNKIRVMDIALNDMLPIFQGNVEVFNRYIEQETKRNIYTKTLSTLLFSIIVIMVFLWIFNPLKTRLIKNTLLLRNQKEEIEREKERYTLATDGTSIGVWDLDVNTNIFYWNSLLNKILGLDDAQTKYHTDFFQELLHPDDKDLFNMAFADCIRTKGKLDHTCRVMHKDGTYIWVRISGKTELDDDGRAYRLIGSLEDITNAKLAEIQRDIFIEGIEQSGLAMGLIDVQSAHKQFTYVTQSLCEMSGHESKKLLKTNLNAITGPLTNMGDLDAIDSAINEHRSLEIKIESYRQDGSRFWNRLSLHPIRNINSDKTVSHYAVIFEDLTESIEKERLEINRQRNESLGTLASSVAHEINNLLMPMTMAKDILEPELKAGYDPFAIEQLDMMVAYAKQARDIVAGILLFSRKETEDLEHTNIFEILTETISFIKNLLKLETKVEFSFVDDDLKTIACLVNKTEFRQIIANLTKNAEDAFDGKGGHIDISLSQRTISNTDKKTYNVNANDFVTIVLRDNGEGIPEDVIPQIFEPLFSTKPIGSGTGLGLSVVHGILQSWGGFVTVESTVGVGSAFTLHIPIIQDDENFSYLQDLIESEEL
jgi:PAS domain S-box-containing protein